MEFPTITNAIEQFLDEPELDPLEHAHTHKTYRSGLRAFAAFLADTGRDPDTTTTSELAVSVIRDFYRWLRRATNDKHEPLSDMTVSTYLAAVTAWLRYLELQHGPASVLTFEVARARARLGKMQANYPPLNLPEQMPRVLLHYDNLPLPKGDTRQGQLDRLNVLRNRAVMHVIYTSAGRISEVASLNRSDVEDGHKDEAIIQGKGGHYRVIYFSEEALDAIKAYLKERGTDGNPALFANHRATAPNKRRRLTAKALWDVVKRAAKAVGVPEVTPHYFRHYRGSKLLEAGLTLPQVQEVLGHRSVTTTRRIYIHLDKERLKRAVLQYSETPQSLLIALERKEQEREARGG